MADMTVSAPPEPGGPPTVVVTGASTGIGKACALHLDSLGWRVFAGVRRESDGNALTGAASERLIPVYLDVTDSFQITEATELIGQVVGDTGLQGLVNNAGIAVVGPLEFLPVEWVRRQLEINLIGQVTVTQAFLPLLRRGKGKVVFMGSIGGLSAMPFYGAYCASKFGLEALADSLRVELRPWKIPVVMVEPGAIRTPIWEKSLADTPEFPYEAGLLYGSQMAYARDVSLVAGQKGIAAEAVAQVVARILRSGRPRPRYLVGPDAHLRAWLERLPWQLRDWLVAHLLLGHG